MTIWFYMVLYGFIWYDRDDNGTVFLWPPYAWPAHLTESLVKICQRHVRKLGSICLKFQRALWDQNGLHHGAIQLKWQPNAYRSGKRCAAYDRYTDVVVSSTDCQPFLLHPSWFTIGVACRRRGCRIEARERCLNYNGCSSRAGKCGATIGLFRKMPRAH